MDLILRHRSAVARPAILAALGLLPLGFAATAQHTAPRPPGEVPYLHFPPVTVPGGMAPQSATPQPAPGAPLELRSSTTPAARTPAKDAPGVDALKQRDQELAAARADQKKALE